MLEEANLGPAPEERTEMLTIYETQTKFEYQNKLRPNKGKPEAIVKKENQPLMSFKPPKNADSAQNQDRNKDKNAGKSDPKKDKNMLQDSGASLFPPADLMEKSFKEDGAKKVPVKSLDETRKPLFNRNEEGIDKKFAVSEYINSPQKKKLLKKVHYSQRRRRRNHQRRRSPTSQRKF
jgi:hypothetical protein